MGRGAPVGFLVVILIPSTHECVVNISHSGSKSSYTALKKHNINIIGYKNKHLFFLKK